MFFSIIVPTFGRPDEVTELLTSLEAQQNKNFEVILADGSLDDSVKDVADTVQGKAETVTSASEGTWHQ